MLVLSRKVNEKIIIDDNIEIVLVEISKDQVKIGINAPRHIKVHRWEVYEEIQRENKEAAKSKDFNPLKSLSTDILAKLKKKSPKKKK